MLKILRHHLVLLLFLLLPFHALLVTVGTKVVAGAGQAPLPYLAIWKEGLIALLFLIAIFELFLQERSTIKNMLSGRKWILVIEKEKGLILLLLALAVIILPGSTDLVTFIYGFKYVFVPLIFFLVLRSLTWEQNYLEQKLLPLILITGGVVALYGIFTFFLPVSFFTALGYSDAHSLYTPGGSLSAFQQISDSGIRRIQSVMSGPNQLGLWLLLPWSVGIVSLLRGKRSGLLYITVLSIALALLLTFSRSAWIAAFVITLVACGMQMKGAVRMRVLSGIISATLLALIILWVRSPELIQRGISNRHHFERTRDGLITMIQHPLGLGLGTAGPASNRVSDPCIYFDADSDISWANDRSDLCLFVGGSQVQPLPSEKVCTCPMLPENWYVQIGIELGILGFLLFLGLIAYVLNALQASKYLPVFLAFLGISIAALFLHAWEDSAVAYTVWGLCGIVLSICSAENKVTKLIMNNE
jgi:hypothetical protein